MSLIVSQPGQTDGEFLAGVLAVASTAGYEPAAVAVDTSGPRMAVRVPDGLYEAWLDSRTPIAAPVAGGPADGDTDPAAAAEGSAAAVKTTARKTGKGRS